MAFKLLRTMFGPKRARFPSLEIHVPISPTDHFFTMVHYLAASLCLNGGRLAASPIVVTVGADQEPENLHARLPWSRRYPIVWRWLDRELFRRHSYYATALERFRYPYRSDLVLMLDADIVVAAPFDDLVERVVASRCLAGFIAHGSPFWMEPSQAADLRWRQLFHAAGLYAPKFVCEHTAWGALALGAKPIGDLWSRAITDPHSRYCPPYFNLGFLMAPAKQMSRLGAGIYDEMRRVDRFLNTIYRCQLAVTLSVERLGLAWKAVGAKYNFANRSEMEVLYPAELADVRVLHYLVAGAIDKAQDFRSPQTVAALLARKDLTGANLVLQSHLERIHRLVVRDNVERAA